MHWGRDLLVHLHIPDPQIEGCNGQSKAANQGFPALTSSCMP